MSLIKYLFVTDFTEQEVFSTPVQGEENQALKKQASQIASENLKEEDKQFQHTINFKEKIYTIFALRNENQYLGVLVTLKSFQQHSLAFTCLQDILDMISKNKNEEQEMKQSQLNEQLEKLFEEFLDNIENQKEKKIFVDQGKFKNEFLVDEQQLENFSDLQSEATDDPGNNHEVLNHQQQTKGQFGYVTVAIFIVLAVSLGVVFYYAYFTNLFQDFQYM